MSWRKCTSCKKDIGFKALYWICNVSTCTRKRTGLVFCSVSCWDAHVPVARHKESWAVEMKAPSEEEWKQVAAGELEDMTFPKREKEKVEEPEPEPKRAPSGPAPVILRRSR